MLLNQQIEENRKLRHRIHTLNSKLKESNNLVDDSLQSTFIAACPCSSSFSGQSMKALFKLRKTVMQLRDLCSRQECELIILKNGATYENLTAKIQKMKDKANHDKEKHQQLHQKKEQ